MRGRERRDGGKEGGTDGGREGEGEREARVACMSTTEGEPSTCTSRENVVGLITNKKQTRSGT